MTAGALALLRRLTHAVRSALVRTLHPRRRRAALARLRTAPLPTSILFVCHGNICRSPYAARAFRRLVPEPLHDVVRVESAGFIGAYRSAPREAMEVAWARGVDLADHASKVLTPQNVFVADLIVVMDPAQGRAIQQTFGRRERDILVLGDLDPLPADSRTIRDPVDQALSVFEESYDLIDRCLYALVEALPTR